MAMARRTPGARKSVPGRPPRPSREGIARLKGVDLDRVAILEYDFRTGQLLIAVFPDHVLEHLDRLDEAAAEREFLRAELRRIAVDDWRRAD